MIFCPDTAASAGCFPGESCTLGAERNRDSREIEQDIQLFSTGFDGMSDLIKALLSKMSC